MLSKPLEEYSYKQRPTIANQLDKIVNRGLETPESFPWRNGIHRFDHIDRLAKLSENSDNVAVSVVYDKSEDLDLMKIAGIVTARFVGMHEGSFDKKPKTKDELPYSGVGWVVDQIGIGALKLADLDLDEVFKGKFKSEESRIIVPVPNVHPRNRFKKLIGIGINGFEEYPFELIGDSTNIDNRQNKGTYISHTQVNPKCQVYSGVFASPEDLSVA